MPTVESLDPLASLLLSTGSRRAQPLSILTINNSDSALSLAGQASDCFYNKDECEDAGMQYSSIAKVSMKMLPTL